LHISPVGAFKYNSRNKNCVLFLEDESKLGSRLYYGEVGSQEYYDQEINDILLIDIDEIDEDMHFTTLQAPRAEENSGDSISNYFNFKQIKDVIDIDADIKEQEERKELVSSYILSPSLEDQIGDFFYDLEQPKHKSRLIIGNYGSGKSHLVGFLVSLVDNPELVKLVQSEKIQKSVEAIDRKFFHVQFELQSGQVELRTWFYGKIRNQLSRKYGLEIPNFDRNENYDDKENVAKIIELIKKEDPTAGLLVVIDEVSDFLMSKQKASMKSDLQFIRVLGQISQDQDFVFIGSMQEDIFSSPRFKDLAMEVGRVGERFQHIIIHKEDVRRVISNRIVPKNEKQRHVLEDHLSKFAEKIESVSVDMEAYIDLFPLTPFLIDMFSELPYFEKRGVIQFALTEIKKNLTKSFPFFITFERIYDLLIDNPNKRNLEEIYEINKVMEILIQKIQMMENKYRENAVKIAKAVAVYALWDKNETGVRAEELANELLMLPSSKSLSAKDYVSLVIKKIREVTDGEYIKARKTEGSQAPHFYFETKVGVDPEEKIQQKAAAVSDEEIEDEIFRQLKELLELNLSSNVPDIFLDECSWPSTKSFRMGHIIFVRRGSIVPEISQKDYALLLISPFASEFKQKVHDRQIVIHFRIPDPQNVELFKEVVAIRNMINNNYQKTTMAKKLEQRIDGFKQGSTFHTGIRYRLAKLLLNFADCSYNGIKKQTKQHLGRESASVPEIIDSVKTAILDKEFADYYSGHPVYPSVVSSATIGQTCTSVCQDIAGGNYTSISRLTRQFLDKLQLLNTQGYPDFQNSQIALNIMDTVKSKGAKVTDIEKDLVKPFSCSPYGLERGIIYVFLIFFVVQGKMFLQEKGGGKWDINNIKEKFKSTKQFEALHYIRMSKDMSFDFAERLMNTLGLNGAQIRVDQDRNAAFSSYKQKIADILGKLDELNELYENLKTYSSVYLDMNGISEQMTKIYEIQWSSLDIGNFTKFGSIENFNKSLPKIEILLREMQTLKDGLNDYSKFIHPALEYMEQALQLVDEKPLLQAETSKIEKLNQIKQDIVAICEDYDKFSDTSQRNPIKGKITSFMQTYKYDVYIPAHEKYVGKGIDWTILDNFHQHPIFLKLKKLYGLKHVSGEGKFNSKVAAWLELKKYKCSNNKLDKQLNHSTFCQECLFPKNAKYTEIQGIIEHIEDDLQQLYSQAEKNVIKLIREYRDNMQYLSEDDAKQIEKILSDKKLPDEYPAELIPAIENLLKEVEVIEVSSDDLMENLFPNNQVLTLSEIENGFTSFMNSLRDEHDSHEIRIKLK
ncbi:MAG: DUF6079 family protein, partial [Candidatus Cloacimonetes bacterium]|nr:DUF6079 family protein [Candidatus Cloacimonadota bacterium]